MFVYKADKFCFGCVFAPALKRKCSALGATPRPRLRRTTRNITKGSKGTKEWLTAKTQMLGAERYGLTVRFALCRPYAPCAIVFGEKYKVSSMAKCFT